jgi:hypothetical protein
LSDGENAAIEDAFTYHNDGSRATDLKAFWRHMTSWFTNLARGALACGATFRSPFMPRYDALQFANIRDTVRVLLDDSRVTNFAFIAKRAADVQRIVHGVIGSVAQRRRTPSDRVFSLDECKTVRNVAWSAAPLPR